MNPSSAKAWLRKHKCYLCLGELQNAKDSLERASEFGEGSSRDSIRLVDEVQYLFNVTLIDNF